MSVSKLDQRPPLYDRECVTTKMVEISEETEQTKDQREKKKKRKEEVKREKRAIECKEEDLGKSIWQQRVTEKRERNILVMMSNSNT